MKAPIQTTDNKPRVLCPAGAQLARCIQVVDLGNQRYQGQASRKLYLAFETCEAKHTFKDEKGPEPFMLQTEFAWFLISRNKKTNLRAFLESWKGTEMTDDEALAFDFEKLLGKPCTLIVAHKPKSKGGGMKAAIVGISPAKSAPPAVNPLVCYEIDIREGGTFNKLPPFLQAKLRESDEFRGVTQGNEGPDDHAAGEGEPDWGAETGTEIVGEGGEGW